MSYHIFNRSAELINGDLAEKIGRGLYSRDLMDKNVTVLFHLKSTEIVFTKVNSDLNINLRSKIINL